jgi:hypothetical protein
LGKFLGEAQVLGMVLTPEEKLMEMVLVMFLVWE